jgi:protocatechuate 3,4-dioxygenase beta subunit
MRQAYVIVFLVFGYLLAACSGNGISDEVKAQDQNNPPVENCVATLPDMLGPFYTPGAPERSRVGNGYVLSGKVLSVNGCVPIPGARIELWMAGPDGEYTDDYRATTFSETNGSYRFESPVPIPYESRPPHIHIKVITPDFVDLITQHYPAAGQTEAEFNLVLTPGEG